MPTDPHTLGERRLAVALRPRTPEVERIVSARIVEFASELAALDVSVDDVADAVEHPEGVGTGDVVQRAGITYRQLHYWTSKGYLETLPREADTSGYQLAYSPEFVLKARLMGTLVNTLRMAPDAASTLSDQIVRNGSAVVDGFRITSRTQR